MAWARVKALVQFRYRDNELKDWVPKVQEVSARVKKTFGYFNNHFRGFAVENSLKMMGMLGVSNPERESTLAKATMYLDSDGKKSDEGNMLDFLGGGKLK